MANKSLVFQNWILIILLGLTQIGINYMSRQGVLFGVSIPEKYRKDERIKFFRKRFVYLIVLSHLLLMIVSVFFPKKLIPGFLALVIGYVIFGISHKRLKNWKEENVFEESDERIFVDLEYSRDKKKYFKKILPFYLIPLIINIIGALILLLNYESIPDPFPIHWGIDGPDGFQEKTFLSVLGFSFIGIFLTIIFIFTNYTVIVMKQNLRFKDEKGLEAFRKSRRALSKYLYFGSIILAILFFVMNTSIYGIEINSFFYKIVTALSIGYFFIGAIYMVIKYGVGGERYLDEEISTYKDDDKYWHLFGTIYYNEDDPAFIVEKKVGLGSTVNFAHPGGKVSGIILLALIIYLIYFIITEL